jgi:glycosyltransferase involved in cell wall biosynthesis
MISLILATLGRKTQLEHCLISILKQDQVDFELLVIDQNSEDFLDELRLKYSNSRVRWINVPFKGLSKARNFGINAANYDYISLVDDDSVFTSNFHLRDAVALLKCFDFVCGYCTNQDGSYANHFFPKKDTTILKRNIFYCIMSPCFFFRRFPDMLFDERLGVGEYFGSGEETDYAIELLKRRKLGLFTTAISVCHPEGQDKLLSFTRRYSYGLGAGALIAKQGSYLGYKILFRKLIGPMVNFFLHVISLKLFAGFFDLVDLVGRICGYFEFKYKLIKR